MPNRFQQFFPYYILNLIDLNKYKNVLEIGSGCGAITRKLGETCKIVHALEGSYQRALMTKERTKDLENVEVFNVDLSNFTKILGYNIEPSGDDKWKLACGSFLYEN